MTELTVKKDVKLQVMHLNSILYKVSQYSLAELFLPSRKDSKMGKDAMKL